MRQRFPKHRMEVRAFRFALKARPSEGEKLTTVVDVLWELRNRLVELLAHERRLNREIKRSGGKPVYSDRAALYRLVSKWAKQDPRLAAVHSHLRQNVVVRVLEGTKRWMEAIREGRAGVKPPKAKARKHYRSLTFPEWGNGCRISGKRVWVSGVGWIRMHSHRKIPGRKKTATIKFTQGRWWCIITAQVFARDLYEPARDGALDAGVDPGLTHLLADSHGQVYDPPKAWHDHRARLRKAQRVLSRKFEARKKAHKAVSDQAKATKEPVPALSAIPYSRRLQHQIRVVAKIHTKIERIRNHHHKKNAAILADRYRRIACEDHPVDFMIRNRRMAKAASDRAIHAQKHALASRLGARFHATPNRRAGIGGNSQTCVCSASVPKELKDREHRCPDCGLVAGRDHVSANIVQLIAFGTVSATLENKFPAGGQLVIRRGGSEAGSRESTAGESARASEVPVKRQSPKSSSRATPRVRKLPRKATPAGIAPDGALLLAPKSRTGRKAACKGTTKASMRSATKKEARPL